MSMQTYCYFDPEVLWALASLSILFLALATIWLSIKIKEEIQHRQYFGLLHEILSWILAHKFLLRVGTVETVFYSV